MPIYNYRFGPNLQVSLFVTGDSTVDVFIRELARYGRPQECYSFTLGKDDARVLGKALLDWSQEPLGGVSLRDVT